MRIAPCYGASPYIVNKLGPTTSTFRNMTTQTAKPPQQDKVVRSYRNRSFVLTARKLGRIVEVSRERIEKVRNSLPVIERFSVTFANSKDATLSRLEDVLALDNGVKNRIIEVKYSIWAEQGEAKPHWILVDYDAASSSLPVQIAAASNDLPWIEEAIGAIEEQVDRTLQSDISHMTKFLPVLLFIAIFWGSAISSFSVLSSNEKKWATPPGLSLDAAKKLADTAKVASTDSEKIDFIHGYLAATLEASPAKPSVLSQYASDYRTYLIGIPLAIAFIAAFAAIRWFSPRRVFVWGDYEEHYNKLVERRKFLWYGVVGALIIGILGNLFMLGVTPSLGPK